MRLAHTLRVLPGSNVEPGSGDAKICPTLIRKYSGTYSQPEAMPLTPSLLQDRRTHLSDPIRDELERRYNVFSIGADSLVLCVVHLIPLRQITARR